MIPKDLSHIGSLLPYEVLGHTLPNQQCIHMHYAYTVPNASRQQLILAEVLTGASCTLTVHLQDHHPNQ